MDLLYAILVLCLGDTNHAARAKAHTILSKSLPASYLAVSWGSTHSDPEIAARSATILREWAAKVRGPSKVEPLPIPKITSINRYHFGSEAPNVKFWIEEAEKKTKSEEAERLATILYLEHYWKCWGPFDKAWYKQILAEGQAKEYVNPYKAKTEPVYWPWGK